MRRNFSINAAMAHDSTTATALAIAGAVANGGDDASTDHFVLMTIKNARNLKPMNTNRQSDPYCVLRFLNVERRTRTHKNNLSPDFNQHFFFKAPTEVDVAAAEEVGTKWRWKFAKVVLHVDQLQSTWTSKRGSRATLFAAVGNFVSPLRGVVYTHHTTTSSL